MKLSKLINIENWISFAKREFKDDSVWIFRDLGRNALTLSGFSFVSIFFIFNYFKDNLSEGGFYITSLFLCALLFLFSSEIAREGWQIWRYLASEAIYLFSIAILFVNLLTLMTSSNIIGRYLLIVFLALIGFFFCKAGHTIYVFTDLYEDHAKQKS